jgi:hypothetical protein
MQALKRFLTLVLVATVVIASAMVGLTKPALADGESGSTIRVPMKLDCENLKGSALEYAIAHGLCPLGDNIHDGIVPNDVRWGNCGSSWLFIEDLGNGIARFHMGATSTLGPIVRANYNVSWLNWSAGSGGNVSGSDWLFSTTWSRTRDAYTGRGFVSATMTGNVLLVWGGTCTFLYPSDDEWMD